MLGAAGFSTAAALRMASTSAWAVGSPVSRTRFWPRATISPSLVMTAPNGPPQLLSTDSLARRHASSMKASRVIVIWSSS